MSWIVMMHDTRNGDRPHPHHRPKCVSDFVMCNHVLVALGMCKQWIADNPIIESDEVQA